MTTKAEALMGIAEYARWKYGRKAYIPGDEIPVSGAVISDADIAAVVSAA